jgi:hypothetical protein
MRPHLVDCLFVAATVVAGALVLSCGNGATSYSVSVAFDSGVQQADMDGAAAVLRRADSHAEMLVTETFPPIGHATVRTSAADFCGKLRVELSGLSHVAQVTCEEAKTSGGADGG